MGLTQEQICHGVMEMKEQPHSRHFTTGFSYAQVTLFWERESYLPATGAVDIIYASVDGMISESSK